MCLSPQNSADSKSPKARYVQHISCMASRDSRSHDVLVHEDRHGPLQDNGHATISIKLPVVSPLLAHRTTFARFFSSKYPGLM